MSTTKSNIFRFKQFTIDQTHCGMKVNTDGVLLGALAESVNPVSILDIGTGTGVIALMMAQRFPYAQIDALEIDTQAAETAHKNFGNSGFCHRLRSYPLSFQDFSKSYPEKKYDLIVSNPPFFTKSLKNLDVKKHTARHAGDLLFNELVYFCKTHLTEKGSCCFIFPLDGAEQIIKEGAAHQLQLNRVINVHSSDSKPAHRQIFYLSFNQTAQQNESFIIYEAEKVYSEQYKACLKDFLTIF